MTECHGAVDIGTNSVRLLIGDGVDTVERRMRITRLGRDVDRTGRLDPAGVDAPGSVLAEYGRLLEHHGVVVACRRDGGGAVPPIATSSSTAPPRRWDTVPSC
ncbi:MAG: hypothetical protein R2698_07455 [Microthrixaceae bacterium]